MFKSLLRTIPTLSGNVKINCYLNNFTKDKNDNDKFYCCVTTGDLSPLQNSLLNQRVKLSFINGLWEYDVAKYFHYYNDKFYNENFLYNTSDYQVLDLYSTNRIQERNKDYEFGCKRISYQQTGYQFNFYAPIWCDDFNSLPEYFRIKIKFDNNIIKEINIPIKIYDNSNYLRNYLKKYFDKIDDNVVFGNHINKNTTYFGIDVKNGGFVNINDNMSSKIYHNQMTLNNFDYNICCGFKRNNLIIRQVLPLSFSFNIEDIMDKKEIKRLKNHHVVISGNYIKSENNVDFYDFNVNYYDYKYLFKYYDKDTNNFILKYSSNIYDNNYPCLKEKRYIKYKYTNKITPVYNKWKLKYSSDELPYITNLNYAFSLENSIYGNYPNINNLTNLKIKSKDISLGNAILDFTSNEYIRSMNSNISSWFSLYYDDNIFKNSLMNDTIWENVIDNNVYYKGVLYSFSEILKIYNYNIDISKFALFIKPKVFDVNKINSYNNTRFLIYKNSFIYCNICLNEFNANTNDNYPLYDLTNTDKNNYCIENNVIVYNDDNIDGKEEFIKFNTSLKHNRYYLERDVKNFLKKYNENSDNIFIKNTVNGYLKLPIGNNINLFNYSYMDLTQNDKNRNDDNINKTFIFSQALNKGNLYYSVISSEKKPLTYDENLLNIFFTNTDLTNYNKVNLFVKDNFISDLDLYNFLDSNVIFDISIMDEIRESLNIYNYIPVNYTDKYVINDYFDIQLDNIENDNISYNKDKYSDNYIWVLKYNIDNISKFNNHEFINKKFYAKFINREHIKEYFDNIKKVNDKDVYKNIYYRQRVVTLNNGVYEFNDLYCPLCELIQNNNQNVSDLDYLLNIFSSEKNNNGKFNVSYYKVNNNERTNKLIDLDLYYYDTFCKVDDKIYEFIKEYEDTHDNEFYSMFFYILDNDIEDNYDNFLYYGCDRYNNVNSVWYKLQNSQLDNLKSIYNSSLKPLLNSIYGTKENNFNTKEIFTNNMYIKKIYCSDRKINYYKYVDNNNDIYIDLNLADRLCILPTCFYINFDYLKGENGLLKFDHIKMTYDESVVNNTLKEMLYDYYDRHSYISEKEVIKLETQICDYVKDILINNDSTLYEDINMRKKFFLDKYDELVDDKGNFILFKKRKNIDINHIKNMYHDQTYNDLFNNYNLNIYKDESGKYYAYYIIEVLYDNTTNTLSYENDDIFLVINKINNESILTYNQSGKNYSNFYKIIPYIKTNIFYEVLNSVNTIIQPTEFKLNVNYSPVLIDNGSSEKSKLYNGIFYNEEDKDKNVFGVEYNKNSVKKLVVYRYFNSISPLLERINNNTIKDRFALYYKSINNTISENNIYKVDIDLTKYKGLKVCKNIINNSFIYHDVLEFEYKHFNDNKFYNLEKEILIKLNNKLFTYSELLEYEKEEIILEYFKKYLNKSSFYNFTDDEILFLYNRYKLNILSNPEKLNKGLTEKLYSLQYKFTLI